MASYLDVPVLEGTLVRLERLGATFEGVLRSWSFSWAPGEDGRLRDSAMFSVVESEWPLVKAGLAARVARYSGG
ncbi:hypothetical protein [Stackebrandtia nassauensis]|uniref:hypothetical protein n=1 Tax=Stackebrandtia nassauensis TaxID=283811 RepID=UPI0001A3A068|nr:hypothetical protein [Stackebrandtia nassauensis]